MKEWKKPKILDLDIKLTKLNGVVDMSGGIEPVLKWQCPACLTLFNTKEEFYIAANHKEDCPVRKGVKIGPIQVIQ